MSDSMLDQHQGALAGLKVADFGWYAVGPLISSYLGDYGGIVARVDALDKEDVVRGNAPFKDNIRGANRSGGFTMFNWSKYSIAMRLDKPKGVALAKRLVAWADVVVENFSPGAMRGMGLGYEQLKEVNPRVIMLSTSVYGQNGPRANQRGIGHHLLGLAGFAHATGWPDRPPVGLGTAYTDFILQPLALTAIIAALEYRDRTGLGQHIDISQCEAGLAFLEVPLLDCLINGRELVRRGNRSDDAAPHGVYPCLGNDRWCAIEVHTDEEWQALLRVMGDSGLKSDHRFATFDGRLAHAEEVDQLMAAWTVNLEAEEVMTMLQGAGVAAGIVQNTQDLMDKDPQLKHREHFVSQVHAELGSSRYPGHAAKLSKTPGRVRMPAPRIGEHTTFICQKLLGMSEEEIAELAVEGIVEQY